MARIQVIVPVGTPMWNEPVAQVMEEHKAQGTQIDVQYLPQGPDSLEFGYDKAVAELPTVHAAERAEEGGFDGVIIYCFADPGLAAARESLSIPVVGLCEPSLHIASLLGDRFTIILAGDPQRFVSKRAVVLQRVRGYGFAHKCASIRSLGVPVLALEAQQDEKIRRLVSEARAAVEEDGADTIVLGCGGILHLEPEVLSDVGVPIIVPAVAALKLCEGLIRMRVRQSKLTYATPATGRNRR